MRIGSLKSGILAGGIALLTATWPGSTGRAQTPAAPAANDGAVVARVGPISITAGELERRMAAVQSFQLRALGRTPDEIRRNFLERVLVPELLFSQGAEEQKLDKRADVQDRIRTVLRSILLGRLRGDVVERSPVTDADVRAYYEANLTKYNAPARVAIWRILVESPEEAVKVLAELKKDLTPKRWNEIAREKSVDKATNMRGGNLGFIGPDGSTAEPGLHVAPEIVAAVATAKDGEIVPAPIKEGDRYAIVWRRQSMQPVHRSLEQEAMSIRQILVHQRIDTEVKATLERLRAQHVTEHRPELVDQLDITPSGDLQPMKRPGTLPPSRRPSAGPPKPVTGPGGLR